jgi:regulator of CtrA degradation
MARHFDDSSFSSLRPELAWPRPSAPTISFVQRLAASEGFKALFREGMALVEESANYLDSVGREECKQLPRAVAMAYATESMRLTTRLMQMASWLLLQRAVNEGQMSPGQAASERHRVRLAQQDISCAPEVFEELPQRLRVLVYKSMRMQARLLHLDQSLSPAQTRETPVGPPVGPGLVANQMERLREAFANHLG